MSILAAAGDPGGVRALVPALNRYLSLGGRVVAWKHRDLPEALPEAQVWDGGALPSCERMVFGTSVADPAPLQLARRCREAGMRVECVLDNWMNYRRRLEIDGHGLFVPDAYYVMDEVAREEALREGLPATSLVVSGHPGLSDLQAPDAAARARTQAIVRKALAIPADHRLLAFVSEPVEMDQGADPATPSYRGYTEKQVLAAVCAALRADGRRWGLCVLPHPREDVTGLERSWTAVAAPLSGGIFRAPAPSPREIVAAADGVAGMASILLYEAWLVGRPVLSLQPGLVRPDLRLYRARAGVHCVESAADLGRVGAWLHEALGDGSLPRPEIALHRGAAELLAQTWLQGKR